MDGTFIFKTTFSLWVFWFVFCLYKWLWFAFSTQKIGLFSFYLVHYKFYFKAHKITKYNLTQISKYCFVRQ